MHLQATENKILTRTPKPKDGHERKIITIGV